MDSPFYRFLKRTGSFLSHPRLTLAYRTKPLVTSHLQRWHRHRLAKYVDLNFLAHRPAETFGPDFSDLWFLYRIVRRKKPAIVLEFGSGCSTVVIAQALFDNKRENPAEAGYLYSIDDHRHWANVTSATLSADLNTVCEVRHVPTIEIDYKGTPCFRHASLPAVVPDMIYLDGPTFTGQRKVAVDLLDLEEKLRTGFTLIIDGRMRNTEFLKTHFHRRFVFRHRIWYYNTVVTLNS